MSLKQKTISGVQWSIVETSINQGIQFIVGIILARLLNPNEFGLIGMITIFIAISQSFIDSGFSQALIRKINCSDFDYSTVFFFNLIAGSVLFLVLYFSAPTISSYFKEPELKSIIRVLDFVLIINSLTIIQRTILIKRIDFKLQAKISIISSLGSGVIAITLAVLNFGVWSLVVLQLSRQALNSIFLWRWNRWKPIFVFNKNSFEELFNFGSKLLVSGLIDTIYRNIYYLIIGKYFSASELGYYTRADQFKNLPSQNLNYVIGRVSFPVLSSIQDDIPRLRDNYQKLIRSTMFVTFSLMLCLAAVAKPMILTLIGEKWLPSVIYLQMLCFVGMFFPLQALNLDMLNVLGRSDLFLKLEVIKKTLAIPTIIVGIIWGIKIMISGMMINTVIAYYLNSYWSGKMIGYSIYQQLLDILPSFVIALVVGGFVFSLNFWNHFAPGILFLVQITIGAVLTITISELFHVQSYFYIKDLALERIKSIRGK